mgnify:CR=1 FL=1
MLKLCPLLNYLCAYCTRLLTRLLATRPVFTVVGCVSVKREIHSASRTVLREIYTEAFSNSAVSQNSQFPGN